MEDPRVKDMLQRINNKLGFDIRTYNDNDNTEEPHERDNIPNPFENLTMEELIFIRENNYFQESLECKREVLVAGDEKFEIMLKRINDKLGFDIREYNLHDSTEEPHERDNIPNPFEKMTMEEMLFIRDNNYFQESLGYKGE